MGSMNIASLSVLLNVVPKGFAEAEGMLGRLRTVAKALIGVEAVKSVVHFAERTTAAATEIAKMSAAMGMSIENTQLWSFVAQQSGSDLKQLGVGIGMLERNMRKVADGTASKGLVRNMAAIGIHAKEAKDGISGPDGLQRTMLNLADTAQKMGNTGRRGALFSTALGARAGGAVLSDVSQGRAGLEEKFAERRKMGLLDPEQVANLKILGNEMKNVTGTFSAMGSIVLAKLAPGLISLAHSAQEWIAANRDVISGAFEVALKGVAMVFRAIGFAINALVWVMREVNAAFEWFVDLLHSAREGSLGAQLALVAMGTVILSILIPAVIGMTSAFIAWGVTMIPIIAEMIAGFATIAIVVWTAMLPLLPFILIGAAIAVGVLLIIKYWDKVKAGISAAWSALKSFAGVLKDFFVGIGHGIAHALEHIIDAIRNAPVIKQIVDAIEGAKKLTIRGVAVGDGPVDSISGIGALAQRDMTANVSRADANAIAGGTGSTKNVSIGPTNVTINGVPGAQGAVGAIGRAGQELARRHNAAALGVD